MTHFQNNQTDGFNACGKSGNYTSDVNKVTCGRCKMTKAYKSAMGGANETPTVQKISQVEARAKHDAEISATVAKVIQFHEERAIAGDKECANVLASINDEGKRSILIDQIESEGFHRTEAIKAVAAYIAKDENYDWHIQDEIKKPSPKPVAAPKAVKEPKPKTVKMWKAACGSEMPINMGTCGCGCGAKRPTPHLPFNPTRLHHYGTTPAGSNSIHNGDCVSEYLLGLGAEDMADEALRIFTGMGKEFINKKTKTVCTTRDELLDAYAHLNIGMVVMNIRNRIRGVLAEAFSKEELASGSKDIVVEITKIANGELQWDGEAFRESN
jgi:hypothetical protein